MQQKETGEGEGAEDEEEELSDKSRREGDVLEEQEARGVLEKDLEENDLSLDHPSSDDSSEDQETGAQRPERRNGAAEDEESELDLRNYVRDDILESVRILLLEVVNSTMEVYVPTATCTSSRNGTSRVCLEGKVVWATFTYRCPARIDTESISINWPLFLCSEGGRMFVCMGEASSSCCRTGS